MRANLAIILGTAAVVVLIWTLAVRDTTTAAERGAERYCTALQENGALLEPYAQCLREYREATR